MSRWGVLIGLGVILMLAFALAALPARVVFDLAAGPAGAQAGLVQGPVWDADIQRLSVQGAAVAQVTAGLRPASLLAGVARLDVTLRDPGLRGAGVLTLAPGGAVVEDAAGVIALSRLALFAGLPPSQSASFEIERIAVDRQGRCLEARGQVTTAALAAAGESFGAALPVINGAFFCAGDVLGLQLDGATSALALSGVIRFETDGPAWLIEARTGDRESVAALSLLGFVQDGPGVFRLDSTQLAGQG
jgi:hypothetical protein